MSLDRAAPTSLPRPSCDYAEAWLWVDVDAQSALTATQAITSLDAIAPIDQILETLPQSDAWRHPIGQVGPMENIRDWIWQAHWLSADRLDGSLAILGDCNLPSVARRRLLHISIDARPSDDAVGWLDRLTDQEIAQCVTKLHNTQEQFQILASQDELTGLLNRRFFQVEAQRWIDMLSDDGVKHLALLVFDLDYFRSINDSYGHECGDQLLQEMARRLQNECVASPLLIARMDGDEFAILVETDNKPESLSALGEQVKSLTARPFQIGHLTLFTSASTGIVIWPEHGRSIGELLHQADSAMYAAKEQGRNGHAVFSPELMEHQNRQSALLTALRQSQGDGRFSLVYQVQQNASSLAITGVEALLRWQAPSPELAAGPDQFISLLEKSGLIIDVGGWVLDEACQQIARWREYIGERITVAVNVSSIQLHSPCFIGRVQAALKKSGINPSLLELELTETALVNDPAKAASTLIELKKLGVQLALDDFGTGYSSLSYLTQFEFNRLKIDQSFVRDILVDPKDLVIVKAIVAMGHALGLEVVAEGVETVAERDLLDSLGCDYFQGYLVGRPGKPEEISPMLGVGLL